MGTPGIPNPAGRLADELERMRAATEVVRASCGGDGAPDAAGSPREASAVQPGEWLFRRIVEGSGRGVWVLDAGGRIVYVNPALAEMLGVAPAEVVGCQASEFIFGEDVELARLRADRCGNRPDCHFEMRLARRDGKVVWVAVNVSEIAADEASGVLFCGIFCDVTERHHHEEELEAAQRNLSCELENQIRCEREIKASREAAEAANRAKDHFLATLSHELRAPLTPVLATVQMLLRRAELPEDIAEPLVIVQRNVSLQARLIDDLLDLTRIGRGKLQLELAVVDLHEVVGHAMETCAPDARNKYLTIDVRLSASTTRVRGDAIRIEQILWNLLRNAVKFTPAGGRIWVSTRDGGGEHDGHVVCEIRDSGIGIEPELLPRLFEPFEQGERQVVRQSGGLGLGLNISKGLVDLHGGTLGAASAGLGCGATFTLTLPTTSDPLPDAHPRGQVAGQTAQAGGRRRILLVEDHADTAKVIGRHLRTLGYEVRVAQGVADALRTARDEPFDLLISDIGLPDGSGLELMRQVQAMYAVRGIAMTGYGQEEDVRQSREAGFADHLVKPFSLTQLESALARVLSEGEAAR